ncbi:MAG: twin-arginine translocase TatA/TatE family subunit [Chloroflexia bacterium]
MSLGAPELILILVIVLVVFGAGKLPQVGSALGRGIREFRDASEDHTDTKAPGTTTTTTTIVEPTGVPTATIVEPTVILPPDDTKKVV